MNHTWHLVKNVTYNGTCLYGHFSHPKIANLIQNDLYYPVTGHYPRVTGSDYILEYLVSST